MPQRLRNHLIIGGGSILLAVAVSLLLPYETVTERISVITAWLCLGLLAAALLFGPLYLVGRQSQAANHYLRRDIGIWTALQGLAHFYFGNLVAMNDGYMNAFVRSIDAAPSAAVREQLFGWGSVFGLLVGVLFIVLLVISSDWSLRLLGVKRWKRTQKIAVVALWLTLAHGIAFQVLEARYLVLCIMLLCGVSVVLVRRRAYRATG